MSDGFYRAFEDRYRGSRELIKERLRAYLPFVGPLATMPETAAALDLGCGRGEWLELLGEHGFAARGIDLDDSMLAACRERGLAVETADAIAYLRALPDNSVAVLSAFHLVEHLPFDAVQEMITQSLRVLQPGGLLIMETPNPENLMVGACNFYLDPSHVRPIPPNLLSFLAEHVGFARQKVVRLQEDPHLHTAAIHLINVFIGASPDYSVVAQKSAPSDVLERFDLPFQREYGIGIGELARRFEDGQRAALNAVAEVQQRQAADTDARFAETKTQFEARFAESSFRIAEVQAQLTVNQAQQELQRSALSGELAELRTRMVDAEVTQAQKEQELAAVRQQLDAVYRSTSWRMTAPLRWLGKLLRLRH